MQFNPPHTPCQSQKELFIKKHTPFFILDSSQKFQKQTGFEKAKTLCRHSNSPGGCLELFSQIGELIKDLQGTTSECFKPVISSREFREPLWETSDLLVRIAWGDKPPQGIYERMGWLDNSHLALFCKSKDILTRGLGEERWNRFRETLLNELPGAKEIGRNEAWKLTILSVVCERVI